MRRNCFANCRRRIGRGLLLVGSLSLAGCESKPDESASVEAIDKASAHIRDDIRQYIEGEFPADSDERKAAKQYAASKQAELDVGDEKRAALEAVRAAFRSQSCMNYVLGIERAHTLVMELRTRLLNTAERTEAYLRVEKHLGGEMFMLPHGKDLSGTCDFPLRGTYDE